MAVNWKTVTTYPIADSQTLTSMDPVKLSTGKIQEDTSDLSTDIIGFSSQTIDMGVLATVGQQEYAGVVSEGLIELTGMVEGSGGTYVTDFSVGATVSMYWSSSVPYAVIATDGPVGTVVAIEDGTLVKSGTTADTTGTVTIQIDLANSVSELGAGSVSTAELATNAVTSVKITALNVTAGKIAAGGCTGANLGTDVITGLTASSQAIEVGGYVIGSTSTSVTVDFTGTLSGTAKVFCQPLTETQSTAMPGSITDTNFLVTGTNSQTGDWFAVVT